MEQDSQKKTNSTTLEVSLNALAHNLGHFRSFLKPGTKTMAMVKAFSYGSGDYEVAKWLNRLGVNYLGVAVTDEGVDLRISGITTPIMIMSPSFDSYHDLIKYKLEPELYNFSTLQKFSEFIQQSGIDKYPVHIKIDTGMRRLGFVNEDIDELVDKLKEVKNLKVESVFSHLAASDDSFHDDFTNQQISDFKKATERIQDILPYKFMRHIVNSSGIERFPHAHFDMVRLGIGLYGISPTYQDKLQHISTLKTKISQIKKVKANQTVGYSRKGKTPHDIKIAILPIGYADGFNRKFSNGVGKVLINGKLAPIIGNICMDLCMVNLTGIDAKEGDDAIIFSEQNPISKLAEQIGTIPYEILTSVARRVKRVYLH
ncbi:MAG: alanine racemase [Bacteroidetes bacterium 4572_117]|nr:MAG: alanine racemase [Bacteroidetes bacterium 4572_117]